MTKNLFLFFQPDISDESRQAVIDKWNQYGELTMFSSLISTYTKDTSKLIRSGVLTFVVFFLLAFASVLSNQVIQSLRNRNRMLIYYLSGMSWRDAVLAEGYRILILVLVACGLVFLLGQTGVLMLNWLSKQRILLFYGVALLYVIAMFLSVGAVFLHRLIRENLSEALKNLQQGK